MIVFPAFCWVRLAAEIDLERAGFLVDRTQSIQVGEEEVSAFVFRRGRHCIISLRRCGIISHNDSPKLQSTPNGQNRASRL